MTLDEGIIHAEDVARSKRKQVENGDWEKGSPTERDCIECANEHRQLAEWLKELKAYKVGESRSENPNTCGDAISRDAAIKAIEALQRPIMREESNYYQFKFSGMSEAREVVENLPSVTPQQRTGRWIKDEHENGVPYIWVCGNCGTYHRAMYNYCPSCGAKMEVKDAD